MMTLRSLAHHRRAPMGGAAASVGGDALPRAAPVVIVFGVVRDLRLRVRRHDDRDDVSACGARLRRARVTVVNHSTGQGIRCRRSSATLAIVGRPDVGGSLCLLLADGDRRSLPCARCAAMAVVASHWRGTRVARVRAADRPGHGAGRDRHLAISHRIDAAGRGALRENVANVAGWRDGGLHVGGRAADALDADAIPGHGPHAVFTEWFPYYAWINNAPGDVSRALLWPAWGWRFLAVTVSVVVLMTYAGTRARSAVATT